MGGHCWQDGGPEYFIYTSDMDTTQRTGVMQRWQVVQREIGSRFADTEAGEGGSYAGMGAYRTSQITSGKAGGLFLLTPQRGKKLAPPKGGITCQV
ncbi:hypothetical protein SAMN05216308_101228 [Nitrosospira sp. Nsp13]|nr:hypothetical protein SAMN05216308_101228 [Nitrosospira sp. Nsp13]